MGWMDGNYDNNNDVFDADICVIGTQFYNADSDLIGT